MGFLFRGVVYGPLALEITAAASFAPEGNHVVRGVVTGQVIEEKGVEVIQDGLVAGGDVLLGQTVLVQVVELRPSVSSDGGIAPAIRNEEGRRGRLGRPSPGAAK